MELESADRSVRAATFEALRDGRAQRARLQLRGSVQLFEQLRHQGDARFELAPENMLVAGMGARAWAAEPVEGRHAESGREISIRAAAPVLLADFETEGRREVADPSIEREPGG